MTQQTTNHGWTIPSVGSDEDQWGTILNNFFDDELDRQVLLEDTKANRPSASSSNVKFFHATDEDILYYNDDSSWNVLAGIGAQYESDIEDSNGNTIYDFSNSYVPASIVQELSSTDIGNGAVGSDEISDDSVTTSDLDDIDFIVSDFGVERYSVAQLDDTESHEVSVRVPDGSDLEVYRWGAYDVSSNSAPSGLTVEIADASGTTQTSENTVNNQSTASPVASVSNTSGSNTIYTLRAYNGTGSVIDSPGVGMHFGYRVV